MQPGARIETLKWDEKTSCAAISPDQTYLLLRSKTGERGMSDVYLYDRYKNEIIRKMLSNVPGARYYITPDGKNILVKKYDDDKGALAFEMFDIKTGKIDSRFDHSAELIPVKKSQFKLSEFSPKGKRFFAIDESYIQIWNYNTGDVLKVNKEKSNNHMEWVSDDMFIVVRTKWKNRGGKEGVNLYKINENETMSFDIKEKIAEDIKRKTQDMYDSYIHVKNLEDGKHVAFIVGGRTKIFRHERTYIDIWNVESEEKLISKECYNLIEGVMYNQKEKILLTIDKYRNHRTKIKFFDIVKGEWKKEVLLPYGYFEMISVTRNDAILGNDGNSILLLGLSFDVVHLD